MTTQSELLQDAELEERISQWETVYNELQQKDDAKIEELSKYNAELELQVVKLREALIRLDGWLKERYHVGLVPSERELLSTPFTTTALPALVEKVERMTIERCSNTCERFEYPASREAEAIRNLPTGQIDLKELL